MHIDKGNFLPVTNKAKKDIKFENYIIFQNKL